MKHFKSVNVIITRGEGNSEVIITTGFFTEVGEVGRFFVPTMSINIPDVIKSRAKHDLGITYDHHTLTLK